MLNVPHARKTDDEQVSGNLRPEQELLDGGSRERIGRVFDGLRGEMAQLDETCGRLDRRLGAIAAAVSARADWLGLAAASEVRGWLQPALEETESLRLRVRAAELRREALEDLLGEINDQMVDLGAKAHQDPLTGICNRRAFDALLPRLLQRAERNGTGLAPLYLDVDHFKRVNDVYGHLVGDEVLRAIAGRLGESIRGDDVVARIGGEEFAVLISGFGAERAIEIAGRLRLSAEVISTTAGDLPVSLSAGLAWFEGDEDSLEMCRRADAALYRSKQGGRDRLTCWSR